jgi:hypothetical protein
MITFVPSLSCACRTSGPDSGTEIISTKPKVEQRYRIAARAPV